MTDEEFLHSFENCSLPFEQWDHRAHVKVAFLCLSEHSFDEAVRKIRAGIKAFNQSNGVPEGPTTGYNETTTVAFAHLVASTISAYGELFPTPNADTFCDTHPQLLNKHILRLFYSPERRGHPDAKFQFLEPDLAALPKPTDQARTR